MFKYVLSSAFVALHLAIAGGCTTYHPVTVAVGDAETGKPIAGAQVYVSYLCDLFSPAGSTSITNANGESAFRAADRPPPMVAATQAGYLWMPGTVVRADEGDPKPQRIQLWLYRTPAPSIELVVPNGYHGLLRFNLEPSEKRIQDEPGKRQFVFHASPTGFIKVAASPLLMGIRLSTDSSNPGTDIHARFEDGTKIPTDKLNGFAHTTDANQIALRHSFQTDSRYLFVIGTEADEFKVSGLLHESAMSLLLTDTAEPFRNGDSKDPK